MNVTIDSSGRFVLPKLLREKLGLRPNAELEIVEQSNGVLLRVVDPQPSMVKYDGLWVHQGANPDIKWDQSIEDVREERSRSLHQFDYNPLDRDYIKNDPYDPFHDV